jgi:hypothetical protein
MADAANLQPPGGLTHTSTDLALRRSRSWAKLSLALAGRSLRNPALGIALLRVAWRFRSRDWIRRAPFLPLPDQAYLKWRMYTAYGDENIVPPADDIARYALWAVREP